MEDAADSSSEGIFVVFHRVDFWAVWSGLCDGEFLVMMGYLCILWLFSDIFGEIIIKMEFFFNQIITIFTKII